MAAVADKVIGGHILILTESVPGVERDCPSRDRLTSPLPSG
jgi:hypothetical protein